MNPEPSNLESRLPHAMAVLLVALVFPLIWVGGLVTTYEAGMAVPDWPTTYGYNLFLYPWQTWLFGPWDLFVEHGHRLFAATVGLLTIVLVVVLFRREPRRWVRVLGVVALTAVILQGILGGLRVTMDERLLARVHGCFGPVFFGLMAALAVVTSCRWKNEPRSTALGSGFPWLATLAAALAYVQIVLGAHLRHLPAEWSASAFRTLVMFHLLGALLLAVQAAVIVIRSRRLRNDRWLRRPALGLAVVVAAQILLGAGAWVVNYSFPQWLGGHEWSERFVVQAHSWPQAVVTTAHVATGSLIFALALVLTIRAFRAFPAALHPNLGVVRPAGVVA